MTCIPRYFTIKLQNTKEKEKKNCQGKKKKSKPEKNVRILLKEQQLGRLPTSQYYL